MKQLISILLLFVSLISQSQTLFINEVQSSNINTLEDEEGDYPDWIEIYNAGTEAVDLTNYLISDDASDLKWRFPNGIVGAQDYFVVFASGKNRAEPNLHTSFQISSEGEAIILADPYGNILDSFPSFVSDKNISYARITDGSTNFDYCYTPTPYSPNNHDSYNPLNISHQSAIYDEDIQVEISTSKTDNTIHYTLDGSVPTIHSPIYTEKLLFTQDNYLDICLSYIPTTPLEGPEYWVDFTWKPPLLPLPQAHTLRYQSFQDNIPNSPVYTQTYLVRETTENPFDFCIISLTTDSVHLFSNTSGIYIPGVTFTNDEEAWDEYWPNGNYYGIGRDWERPAHMDFFEADGQLAFSQGIGMRIKGLGSAALSKKSLNIYARRAYGKKDIDYPFFGAEGQHQYKRISLRNSGNDFIQTHFRDALLHDLLKDLDLETQRFRPAITFINGEYWGIYNIRERYTRHYFESYFGIEQYDLDLLENKLVIEEGDSLAFQAIHDYIELHDLSDNIHYQFIANQLDIDNCIDYHIAEIFFGNYDWPGNNVAMWRQRSTNSKWRWAVFDLDLAFGFLKENNLGYEANNLLIATTEGSTTWPNFDWSTLVLRNLLKNESFKNQFLERFAFHLNHTFHTDTLLNKINYFQTLYEKEIPLQIQRWSYPKSVASWRSEINVMRDFAQNRHCFVKAQLINFFDLEDFPYQCKPTEEPILTDINIYPNPSQNTAHIILESPTDLTTPILLYNTTGQIVIQLNKNLQQGINIIDITVEHLPKGIYFVDIPELVNPTLKLVVN